MTSVTGKSPLPPQLRTALLFQVIAILAIALGLCLVGWNAALSALAGGLIVLTANAYSVWRVFLTTEQRSGAETLSNLYRSEAGKLIMVAALFIAVFAGWKNVNLVAFIAGCVTAMVANLAGTIAGKVDKPVRVVNNVARETSGDNARDNEHPRGDNRVRDHQVRGKRETGREEDGWQ